MTTQTLAPSRTEAAAAAARWLTAAAAVLVAGASAAGLGAAGLYSDDAAVAAMLRGYDLVTLVVVAPLLALSLLPGWRDRPAGQLVRVSMLVYCVYNYAYYLFGAQLNAALLAHIAIFTASLYALVLSLVALDVDRLAARFRPRAPVRTVAAILGLLAVSLAAIQVLGLAGFALTGAVPQEPSQLVVPLVFTRLGAVLDLSLLVPAYLLAVVWLWRRRAWGFLLATAMLVAGALHQVSYMTGMLFQLAADVPGAAFDPYEPIIVAVFIIGGGLLLANLRPAMPQPTPSEPDGLPAPAGTWDVRIDGHTLIHPLRPPLANRLLGAESHRGWQVVPPWPGSLVHVAGTNGSSRSAPPPRPWDDHARRRSKSPCTCAAGCGGGCRPSGAWVCSPWSWWARSCR